MTEIDRDELISGECLGMLISHELPPDAPGRIWGDEYWYSVHMWRWLDIGGGGPVMPKKPGSPLIETIERQWREGVAELLGQTLAPVTEDDIPEDADAGIRRRTAF